MSISDLVIATIVCGLVAFLVYTFPLISQVVIIALMSLLWLSCALQAVHKLWRKWTYRY